MKKIVKRVKRIDVDSFITLQAVNDMGIILENNGYKEGQSRDKMLMMWGSVYDKNDPQEYYEVRRQFAERWGLTEDGPTDQE